MPDTSPSQNPSQPPSQTPGQTPGRALPPYAPAARELDDLELLGTGALHPLTGFGDPAKGVTLVVPSEPYAALASGDDLELVDPEGLPLARVHVERVVDTDADRRRVEGPVETLTHHQYGAFRRLYLTPDQVRERHSDAVTVPVAAPLTEADLVAVRDAAGDRPVLLLALAGHGTPQGVSPVGLLRATLAAAGHFREAHVVAVPWASRGDADLDHDLGVAVVARYAPGEVVALPGTPPTDPAASAEPAASADPAASAEPAERPTADLPPDVAAVVEFDSPPPAEQGLVVFFTGLSGSGKSTLARALHDLLLEAGERTVTSLDGDVVRRHLSAGLTFSKQDRETNIRRIGWVAAEISRHGGVAIVSPIAPFDETRQQVRAMVEQAGGAFFLVHVATGLEECERRDRKGLYAKARRGEIPEFTGISSPYEEPADADVRVDTTGRSIEDVLADVLDGLAEAGYLDLTPSPSPSDSPSASPSASPVSPGDPSAPTSPES